jgi:hypothetical protein
VAGAVSVVVVVEVVVVPSVEVVVVAAVLVSSTTAGASVWVVVSVVVSFFWQPVASAMAATAAKPRVRNFFINLFSLLICENALLSRRARIKKRRLVKIDAQ